MTGFNRTKGTDTTFTPMTAEYLVMIQALAALTGRSANPADRAVSELLYSISGAANLGDLPTLQESVAAFVAGAIEKHIGVGR